MKTSRQPKTGRPTKFKPVFASQVAEWYAAGLTDAEVAKKLGIARSRLSEWRKRFPALQRAAKAGKKVADHLVERALFQRAIGCQTPDTYFNAFKGEVTATPTVKHYPPDVLACIFWLKNRRPERWQDVQGRANETTITYRIDPKELEIARRIARERHGLGFD
jgi:transcriptional regulator with XRE-family HTH domain